MPNYVPKIKVGNTEYQCKDLEARDQIRNLKKEEIKQSTYTSVPTLDYDLTTFIPIKKTYNRNITDYAVSLSSSNAFKGFATRVNCSNVGKILGFKVNRLYLTSSSQDHPVNVRLFLMDDSKNIIEYRDVKIPYEHCNQSDYEYEFMMSADLTSYNNVYIGLCADLNDSYVRVNSSSEQSTDPYCTANNTYNNLYISATSTEYNWRNVDQVNNYAMSCSFLINAVCDELQFNHRMNNLKVTLDINSGYLKCDKTQKTLSFTTEGLVFFSGYPGFARVSTTEYDISALTPNSMHTFGIRKSGSGSAGAIFYIGATDKNYKWQENEVFLCRLWVDGDFLATHVFSFLPVEKIIDSDSLAEPIRKKTTGILMPSYLYGLSGDESFLYIENAIMNCKNLNNYDFFATRSGNAITNITNPNVTKLPRIILPYNGNGTVVFNLKDYLSEKTYSKNVTVKKATKTNGASCKMIVVADSFRQYEYGDGILKYIQDFATADNMTITMVGTLDTAYNVSSEARGGWTESDFYTLYVPVAQRDPTAPTEDKKMPSPFVFSDDDTVENAYFSFAKYINDNDLDVPDIVMFALGMNYDSHKGEYIDAMITNIHNYNPNIKIIVSTIAACPKLYNGQYYSVKDVREEQNRAYISLFDNREAEKIYICSEHLSIDGNVGIQGETVNANPTTFASSDIISEWRNTGIHPTEMGAWCIAKCNYETIGYVMQQ